MKFLAVLILVLFGLQSIAAQAKKGIAVTRNEVNSINRNLKKYTKKTSDVENVSLEGTKATFYAAGKDLKKISAEIYGETYRAAADFYYKKGKLIFARYKLSHYNESVGSPNLKVTRTEEKQFYFTDEQLIKLFIDKVQTKSAGEQFKQSETEIAELSKTLREAFKD